MHTTRFSRYSDIGPARGAHLVDHPARPLGKNLPPAMPVLPRGWAPLTPDQQHAVLEACDGAPDAMVFRIAAMCDPDAEYRVYRLENESWAGLWVAAECWTDCDGIVSNRVLLGLGTDASIVVRIPLEAVNRELAVRGEPWRLDVNPPAAQPLDARRI